ncbi:MAG TPA: TonB-dependent receptor [Niastella sp.]
MKITAFLLLAACLQVSAKGLAQQVSISLKDAPLEKVFVEIQKQAGYQFVYNNRLMKGMNRITIEVKNAPVEKVLQLCFSNQPLTYAIIEKTIIVRSKEENKLDGAPAPLTINIKGVVEDEEGHPLLGVNISVKGVFKSVSTNAKGEFVMNDIDENATLVFSYVGYQPQEIPVQNRTSYHVRLTRSTQALDELMIIGYGTTTKRYATGTTNRITSSDISKTPVTNVLLALQGRTPGVYIGQNNGLPGTGLTVQIRGLNSLTKGTLPLYIIDGVPYLSEPINTQTGLPGSTSSLPSAEGNTNPMNTINPADIESIDVLKDADATAIYGSRAANGVVLITTKKGKAGKTQVSVNYNTSQSKVAHFVETLGTEEYLALRRKGFANNNITPTDATAPDLKTWDTTAYTDFHKELLGHTARSTDLSASLSGGDLRTNFLISGTYHKETNVFAGGQGYRRVGVNFNLNHSSLDKKLNVGLSAIYSADKNNISTTDLTTWAYSLPPNFPLYKADGSLYWTGSFSLPKNPLGYLYLVNENKTSNLLTSLNLKYNLVKGLDVKTMVGYSRTDMDQVKLAPSKSMDMSLAGSQINSAFMYNYTNNYIIEPQATYKARVWEGVLEALVGGTWQFKQSKQPFYTTATGFTSDEFIRNLSLANPAATTRSASQDYKYTSTFGRLNYNVMSRYILNLVFRRDGSSRFGPDKRFGNFGSAGAAWIFSEEEPVKKISWLSFGKIRGSYGIVGNDAIGNYGFLDTYTSTTSLYNGTAGLVPSRLANNEYKWEETHKLEAALELGFVDNRIMVTADFYRNRTDNQLIDYTVSPQAGFTSYQANLPALIENKGWEFTLNTTNIKTKDFSWSTAINVSFNRNKLLRFNNIEKTSYYSVYQVGNPISSLYLYKYAGLDSNGLPTMEDLNKSGAVNAGFAATGRGDRYYAGTSLPEYFGGLSNTVTYKGLSLDVLFQFVKQKGRNILQYTYYPPGYMYNASTDAFHKYLALGSADKLVTATTSNTPALNAYRAYSNYTVSDALFEDASFVRLKNVSLSYNFPAKFIKKAKIQNLRLYVQGQNLFTITNYTGYDPESQGISLPPLRTFATGIQFTF